MSRAKESADADPDGLRLPIKCDATSNGEFVPIPLSRAETAANRAALAAADANARRLGSSRRRFLVSACGAASTLLAFNAAHAAAGRTGGFYELPADAALDQQLAAASVGGDEFIFDVQGHFVDPSGRWLQSVPAGARPFSGMPKAACAAGSGDRAYLECLGPEEFVKDVFLDSDTDMMVLSFVPSAADAEPVTIEAADAVRRIVDELEGTQRLLLHGRVNPNQAGDIERMDELAERWGISAWKTYTQFGPDGVGFYLDDPDTGIPFAEKARATGVKVICVHKGLPFGPQSYEHSQCHDIGRIARLYPDLTFIVYHSGFVAGQAERAFAPGAGRDGIDTLIQSLVDNGLGPGSNVYAELGSTWRYLMRDPDSAAHAVGKLLKYAGPDNVLWGTDSIWYGSPQDQIQAFRSFQIAPELRERHGYPELTPALRAKVFGLNAMVPYGIDAAEMRLRAGGDRMSARRAAYREAPNPHFRTYGPRTRREFLALVRNGGH
ncbi:MAG TPA: amidohydrolase family protein [Pseudomonadales bacterium]|nr:amidohydrolase family protein [Pseudomonadales bacterium]